MEISIIIPLLDSPIVGQTIAGIQAQSGCAEGAEIVVVGRDGFGQVQTEAVTFIDTGRPVPPAIARNRGALVAKGHFLLFVDADAIPTPGWMECLLSHLRAGRPIVSGAVTFPRWNYWTWTDNVSAFHEFIPKKPAGLRRYLPTIGLGVERRVFQQMGLFDDHFSCAEDMDFTLRAYQAGYPLYFEPRAVLLHLPSRVTMRDILRRRYRAGYEMIEVRNRYSQILRTPPLFRRRWLFLLSSPVLAMAATTHLYLRHLADWRDLATFPAVLLTKLAWCAGAFRRLSEEGQCVEI